MDCLSQTSVAVPRYVSSMEADKHNLYGVHFVVTLGKQGVHIWLCLSLVPCLEYSQKRCMVSMEAVDQVMACLFSTSPDNDCGDFDQRMSSSSHCTIITISDKFHTNEGSFLL